MIGGHARAMRGTDAQRVRSLIDSGDAATARGLAAVLARQRRVYPLSRQRRLLELRVLRLPRPEEAAVGLDMLRTARACDPRAAWTLGRPLSAAPDAAAAAARDDWPLLALAAAAAASPPAGWTPEQAIAPLRYILHGMRLDAADVAAAGSRNADADPDPDDDDNDDDGCFAEAGAGPRAEADYARVVREPGRRAVVSFAPLVEPLFDALDRGAVAPAAAVLRALLLLWEPLPYDVLRSDVFPCVHLHCSKREIALQMRFFALLPPGRVRLALISYLIEAEFLARLASVTEQFADPAARPLHRLRQLLGHQERVRATRLGLFFPMFAVLVADAAPLIDAALAAGVHDAAAEAGRLAKGLRGLLARANCEGSEDHPLALYAAPVRELLRRLESQ